MSRSEIIRKELEELVVEESDLIREQGRIDHRIAVIDIERCVLTRELQQITAPAWIILIDKVNETVEIKSAPPTGALWKLGHDGPTCFWVESQECVVFTWNEYKRHFPFFLKCREVMQQRVYTNKATNAQWQPCLHVRVMHDRRIAHEHASRVADFYSYTFVE